MNKIRKGDEVIVLAGRDKGKRGTVLRRVDADHVVVEGVNRVKKHQRPNPMKGITGGIVDKDMPIHVSNVALFNPATKKADRVGIKTLEDGRKVRVFKATANRWTRNMAKEDKSKQDKPEQKAAPQQQQAQAEARSRRRRRKRGAKATCRSCRRRRRASPRSTARRWCPT